MLQAVTWFLLAFATALVLTPLCRLASEHLGLVAQPRSDRWHKRPTAVLGGVALTTTVLGLMAFVGSLRPALVLVTGAGLMFVVGLADDVRSFKPSTKLVAEIAVAALLVFFGYQLNWVKSLTVDTLLTLAWIVGITNAFNLLDNMDGLATGVALIAGVSLLAVYGLSMPLQPSVVFLVLLLGASAGFLVYNISPASIFLGDSGSLFLGISFATLALGLGSPASDQPNVLAVIAVPVFILLIPIFDTTLVTVSRLLSGRTPAVGGRDHASHRLVAIGLSERAAVAVLWVLAAIGGSIGIVTRYVTADWSGLLVVLFLLAMAIFAVYLARVRIYENADESLLTSGTITPFVVDFVYKRRVVEVLLDVCLVSVAYYAAYRLRFEGAQWASNFPFFLQSLPLVVGIQMVALLVMGAYQGVWRYFSLIDGVVFGKSVLLGSVAIMIALLLGYRFTDYSRGVFVIYGALLMILLTGSRASFRLMSEYIQRRRFSGKRLVVYGADEAGGMALREFTGRSAPSYRMIGFIDDDHARHDTRVHGYAVLGGYERLLSMIVSREVDAVLICTPLIDTVRLQETDRLCVTHGVSLSRFNLHIQRIVGA